MGPGRDQVAAYYARTWQALPDGEVTIEGEAFGDDVAVHWGTFRATVHGEFLGVVATGRKLEFPVISVLTFRNGKIRGEHLLFDVAMFCRQLGVSVEDTHKAATANRATTVRPWQDDFVPAGCSRR